MRLGEFIAGRRKILHLTQEELAKKMQVSKSAIAKWETNGGIPDRDNLKKLSSVINVSIDDLHRIISGKEFNGNEKGVNITNDVIALLESYGYKVLRPDSDSKEK